MGMIMNTIILWHPLPGIIGLKRLVSTVGEHSFCQNVVNVDGNGHDAMTTSVRKHKFEHLQYLLSFQGVRDHYAENAMLFRLISMTNQRFDEKIAKYIATSLQLNKEKLSKLQNWKHIDISKILNIL